jgi:MFS family permease
MVNSLSEAQTIRSRSGVASVLLVNVLFAAGLYSHAFLYNFYLTALQLPGRVMGDAAAALTLGGLIALLPAGPLVDRVGARRAYLAAALLLAAGLAAGALVTQRAAIYAAAILAGMGTATWRVAMGPMLLSVTPSNWRARVFSWNVALLVGSGALWTAVAAAAPRWIGQLTGWSPLLTNRVALLLGAAGSVLGAALIAAVRLSRTETESAPPPNLRAQLRVPASFLVIALCIAVWMCAGGLVIPFFNLYFTNALHVPVEDVGLVFAAAQIIGAGAIFLSGELAARFGALRTLTIWAFCFAPLLFGLSFAQTLPLAVLLYVLQSMIPAATNALIDQLLMERAPADRRGAISSWRNAATEGSGFAGASAGGRLLERGSFVLLLNAAAVVALAGAAVLITALRRWRASAVLPAEPAAQKTIESVAVNGA